MLPLLERITRVRMRLPFPESGQSQNTVVAHCSTIRFRPEFIEAARASMDGALQDWSDTQRLLPNQLRQQIKVVGVKQGNLIDPAADGQIAKAKIHDKLKGIVWPFKANLTMSMMTSPQEQTS